MPPRMPGPSCDVYRRFSDPVIARRKMLLMQPKLRNRLEKITFERFVHEGTPAFIRLDATRIVQVW